MQKRYCLLFLFVAVLAFAGCGQQKNDTSGQSESLEAKQLLQGIWSDEDTEAVAFKMKGDTVYRDVDRWHTKYIEKQVHDTMYISKTDSVPVPYPVIKEVEKQLSRRDHMIMCIGVFAIIGALCWFVWWAVKVLRRFGILRI